MIGARPVLALLAAGWIARALASTDSDVDAGIEAYEAGDHEEALARFDAAQARLGERAEIHFDRGLALQAAGKADEARQAFERGTEADDDQVRSSSHYQLGNLAFDAEQWEDAIAQYQSCLRAMPDHQNAKWNLELALRKKQEQEKQEQEKQEQEKQEQEKQEQEEQEQDEQEESEPEQETGGQEQEPEQQEQGEQAPSPEEEAPPPAQGEQAPQPIDRADIDGALEQLDAADQFMLGRPGGPPAQVEKDW